MEFSRNTFFVTGRARLPSANPIAVVYDHLLMVAVIERDTGVFLDVNVNSICQLSSDFIKRLLLGKSIYTDCDLICSEIESHYYDATKKAFCSCMRDMHAKVNDRAKE